MRPDVLPVDLDDAAGRPIDAAEQIEQRRFPAAARPHDRDRLSLLDRPVDAAQRVHFLRRHLVTLLTPLTATSTPLVVKNELDTTYASLTRWCAVR